MHRRKLWSSLRTLTVVGASGLAACATTSAKREGQGDHAEAEHGEGEGESESHAEGEGEGESEGEGEGEGEGVSSAEGEGEGEGESEGEGKAETDLGTDNTAYLTQLGLMRGHLLVGYELFKAGHLDAAKTHMKHPENELYATVAPAFAARGTGGFASELEALAAAVENNAPKATVDAAYGTLVSAIERNEKPAVDESTAARIKLAAGLVRVAAEEYAIAVVDGKMQNAHEYQDAYGFTKIARMNVTVAADGEAKSEALKLLDEALNTMWPGLLPPDSLDSRAEQLYGIAARLDFLAAGSS
ncbi:MAG: hypothetical protein AAFU77_03430 [Myxococcota bacterium]